MTRRRTYVHKQRRPKLPPGLRRLRKEACAGLQAELDETIGELHRRVREIAEKYKKSVAWVRTHLFGGGKSARFVRRELKIRLYDVYVHIKTKELNGDRAVGDKYSLPEIKAKIAKERPNYKNRPREDQEAWIAEYKADKEAKAREPRVNRKGEQQDAAATLKRVSTDLDTLRTRTGVRSVVIAVRPEVLFTMDPFVFCDKHTEEFFSLTLNKTPEQVARLLELSTIHGLGSLARPMPKNAGETRKDTRMRIQQGLDAIITLRYPNEDAPHVQMNYESYDYDIVFKHRVRLVGWTFNNGRFLNPGKLPMDDVHALHDGLLKKSIYWELVPESEVVTAEKRKRPERSDAGEKRTKKKARTATTAGAAKPRKGVRSKSVVSDSSSSSQSGAE
ncbi:hypothetical protein AURDEDRAFT_177199 [Auricularia subglabra TFB-10046 SS5]|uniref:Uncharacterized protein n=1 Tax=Auricularia subglabra (strain TFB-10046 / SS5) TaxID=717982 RepID=J0D4P3_AURST|nr:hypothetical protein AURDEDRAFT_177199 [Auricularia subglabra TFB-10046 SS5]